MCDVNDAIENPFLSNVVIYSFYFIKTLFLIRVPLHYNAFRHVIPIVKVHPIGDSPMENGYV